MGDDSSSSDFLDFLDTTIAWFKKRADLAHGFYNLVRVALVVLAAGLPALTANHLTLYATIAAVIVAALAGLDAQFKPGEQWKHHRSIQLALMRLKREYELADEGERVAAFEHLRKSVEDLLSSEASEFWTFRVIPWTGSTS